MNTKRMLCPYHMHSNKDPEGFNMFMEYPFHELMMLEPKKFPVTEDKIYEDLKRCKENGKKACVAFWHYIFEDLDSPRHRPLKPNWKELLDSLNRDLCEAGGDAFWGYLFDEPLYYMTGDEYLMLTKYMSKYGKHIAAIHGTVNVNRALWPMDEGDSPEAIAWRNVDVLTAENQQYTTDISYDFYGRWEHGIHHTTVFKLFMEDIGELLMRCPNTKFWFTPPIGTIFPGWEDEPDNGEQICLDVLMGMWQWACRYEDHFGGFFLYTYWKWESNKRNWIHGNGRYYLMPDENGNIKWKRLHALIEAIGKGFVEGKRPSEIELPDVGEYDEYGITKVPLY